MPEEDAFCVLVKIMRDYRMHEMFKPSMAELGLCMYQLEVLVNDHTPELFAHFQSQSIHTNLYASSWFLTIFTTAVPMMLACRIMDCFLADGPEVIFRLALALLIMGKDRLLVEDMEGVLRVREDEEVKKCDFFKKVRSSCSIFKKRCRDNSRLSPRPFSASPIR